MNETLNTLLTRRSIRKFKPEQIKAEELAAVLEALGHGLGFPEWYGANLDALNDCLTDFSWNEAPGYVVILSGADTLHALGEPFAQINRVLDNAIQEWRRQRIPFWVFYDLRADGLAFLPTLA